MQHMLQGKNLALITTRLNRQVSLGYFFVSKRITDLHLLDNARDSLLFSPLYLYSTEKTDLFASPAQNTPRKPNFSEHFIHALETSLKLQFIPEGHGDFNQTISALNVFHYMYAVFHSPTYRQRYAEFLKIDFPRLPLTGNNILFKQLADLGEQLVNIHLMETDLENDCSFPLKGDNLIKKLVYKNEKVYINKIQYFDNVKPKIWEFHIGGYQVCEKWLKDRKDRTLSFEDCSQYLYILAAIEKTQEVMEKIDETIGEFPLI
jgi:predicted helicase